jgi:hypothetical protein
MLLQVQEDCNSKLHTYPGQQPNGQRIVANFCYEFIAEIPPGSS